MPTIIGHYTSLSELNKIVDDVLVAGVIEEIIEEGHLLPKLPVTLLDGKSLIYNRESTLPSGDFISPNDTIVSEEAVAYSQTSVTLKILEAQFDLPLFYVDTYTNPIEPKAQAISECRKGVMRTAEDKLIYGNATSYPEEFDGLHALTPSAMMLNQGSGGTGAALSLNNLDKLIDLVKPKPDFLLMPFSIYRRISQLGRANGTSNAVLSFAEAPSNVAPWVTYYRDIPLIRTDFMTQTETISGGAYSAKTGGATGSIFAVRTGPISAGGLSLITGMPLFVPYNFPTLENKHVMRYRLVSYLALALGSTKSLARLDGITDVAVVV